MEWKCKDRVIAGMINKDRQLDRQIANKIDEYNTDAYTYKSIYKAWINISSV